MSPDGGGSPAGNEDGSILVWDTANAPPTPVHQLAREQRTNTGLQSGWLDAGGHSRQRR